MKKTIKKRLNSNEPQNKLIINQVKRTLNEKLNEKLNPLLDAISLYQSNVQSGMLLMQDFYKTQDRRKVFYKRLNLLLVVPTLKISNTLNEIILEEQLRHLVKNVHAVKYAHHLEECLSQQEFDLILVLGSEEKLPTESLNILKQSNIKKAVWLSDERGVTEVEWQLAPLFDYVFTQSTANIPAYKALQCKHCHYMPFASNTSIYFPKAVESRYQSDVLLIGDIRLNTVLRACIQSEVLSGKKVVSYGEGWENISSVLSVSPEEDVADYYNGAKMVINCSPLKQRMLDVSACGTFQLIQEHPDVVPHAEAGEFLVSFREVDDLLERFNHYWLNIDHRRLVASRALADNKYNHSFLQKGMELLDIALN